MPTYTPWGASQSSDCIAPGIMEYSTAGHGGIHLSPGRSREMPECLRIKNGWYEEDTNWARVVVVFSVHFPQERIKHAWGTLKQWLPDAYETLTGTVILPGESRVKDERQFQEDHRDDYVVIAAWGDWLSGVPKGFVYVSASLGGSRSELDHNVSFLVPDDEYKQRQCFGFVIDVNRHPRIDALN